MKSILYQKLEENLNVMNDLVLTLPWHEPVFYGNWLAQTYFYARHTTRLLAMAAAHSPLGEGEYHTRFLEHAHEEKGHEKLLLNDMKFIGFQLDDTRETAAAAALYQTQFYHIQNLSPRIFMGYVLALEAFAARCGAGMNERIEKAHTARGASFIRVHAQEDLDHTAKALEKIAKLPEPVLTEAIANMEQTFERYRMMLRECREGRIAASVKAA